MTSIIVGMFSNQIDTPRRKIAADISVSTKFFYKTFLHFI